MPLRRSQAFALLLATTLLGHATSLSAQDFDPAGRRRRPPPTSPNPRPTAPRSPQQPTEPSKDALIARYMGIVLAQPGAPFPLQRLAQLYRERDGHPKQLIADLEARASGTGKEAWSAKLALAGAYRLDGRIDDAIRIYEAAQEEQPKNAAPIRALAELHRERGDLAKARALYEQSTALLPRADREEIFRTLVSLCLDLDDFEAAKRFHRELLAQNPGSLYVRGELARELMGRGDYARAEIELRALVTSASGDNRTLAPALRDLGEALANQEKYTEALDILNRAERAAGTDAGIRREIFDKVVDIYRKRGELSALVAKLEAERSSDFARLVKLGELYEETGRVDDALRAFEKALRANAKSIDTRLKIIHILHAQGELDRAIKEYEALLRIAPHEPEYAFELAETLIQRGERDQALRSLSEIERRMRGDEGVLARLIDFYERIDEKAKALSLLQRLAASSSRDPSHLIDLGDRYWQEGDKKRAVETWSRIRLIIPNRAKALATLGEVYLDHDMPDEALSALEEAAKLEPSNLAHRKAYAIALERTATAQNATLASQRYEQARAIWELLLENAGQDRNLAREARTHLVTIWALSRKLEAEVPNLAKRFADSPPDLEAGRLLAEAQLRLRRLDDATKTLSRLSELAPGDGDALLALERVLVLRRDLDAAIETLKKLVEVEPRRSREFYRRMAEYAAELYRDEDAVRYAEKAVLLSPDDPEGHKKLGDMYRKRQEPQRAIASFRAALAKNDRLYGVYFDLAELLVAQGETEEADRLYRRVLRACPDEELVARAARQSIEVNLARGTLESLEHELLPIVLGNPRKLLHRRLLVELYGEMAFPLMRAARFGNDEDAKIAREKLVGLGSRALKPLLDALADEREAQKRIAIDVLSFVENRAAGPALFSFATGNADMALREQAMIACGSLRDPSLLPRYQALLLPKDAALLPGDPVAVAAAWGVARLGHPKARPLLSSLLTKGAPPLRAIAALGFAASGDKKAIPELLRVSRAVESGSMARAASAIALGELGAKESVATLIGMAHGEDPRMKRAALLALARLRAEPAPSAIAEALLSTDAEVRRAARYAAMVLANPRLHDRAELLPVPEGSLDVATSLMREEAHDASPTDRARAFVLVGEALRTAAAAAAMTSPERAAIVAGAWMAHPEQPGFAPFTSELDGLDQGLRRDVEAMAESIAHAVVPAFISLERHPKVEVRIRAVSFLATRTEDSARAAVLDALSDPEEPVVLATLAALQPGAGTESVLRVAELLESSPSWACRSRAAEALGRIAPGSPSEKGAVHSLAKAGRNDAYALVREAAMSALVRVDRKAAAPLLQGAAESDVEPRIRELARELLRGPSP